MTDTFWTPTSSPTIRTASILTGNTLVGCEQDIISEALGLSPLLLNILYLTLTD
jgi:hypothetical protein